MYKQLTSEQRYTISVLLQRKCSKKSIAEAIGVHPSTVTRELKRNSSQRVVYKWDWAAMNQTFLLTNMCPQDRTLNSGGWNKVEEKCRKWANRFGEVFIVAGPIFRNTTHRKLGDIPIPEAFYKVILCMNGSPKAIGFIYENNPSSQSMQDTMCSVDEVERQTGFDFFSQLPDDVENDIEATCNLNAW